MRCAEVDRAADRFVDGRLPPDRAAAVQRHAAGCADCRRRLEEARGIGRALAAAAADPAFRAPRGFADRVMDAVYRETLWKPAASRPAGTGRDVSARGLRRIGLCLVLSAVTLSATLLVPRGTLPWAGVGGLGDGPSAVKTALDGAGGIVRSALHQAGGPATGILEGRSR